MDQIDFPFARDRDYQIAKLRAFRTAVTRYRQNDPSFSAKLRCNDNQIGWAKLYNEELVPIGLLADHMRIDDRATFRIKPSGDPVDVVLEWGGVPMGCQITLADPDWSEAGVKGNGGYIRSLQMEIMREGRPAFGGGKTRRERGTIISEPHVRDVMDDRAACKRSLVEAIKRKRLHDGSKCALLIYAREIRFELIDFDIAALAHEAVSEAGDLKFSPLWIVDNGFFWECEPTN